MNRREGQIHATPLCDLVAPLVLILCTNMSKKNLSVYILEIQNVIVVKRSIGCKHLRFQSHVHLR